jgi:hypothetical protein
MKYGLSTTLDDRIQTLKSFWLLVQSLQLNQQL